MSTKIIDREERLKVIIGAPPLGILMNDEYIESVLWLNKVEPAQISDILRVHEFSHIDFLK